MGLVMQISYVEEVGLVGYRAQGADQLPLADVFGQGVDEQIISYLFDGRRELAFQLIHISKSNLERIDSASGSVLRGRFQLHVGL